APPPLGGWRGPASWMARLRGFEPPTPSSGGWCSDPLSYRRVIRNSGRGEGAWAPASALVGASGFEPPTLCSQSRCATRLRYAPRGVILYQLEGARRRRRFSDGRVARS